MKDISETMMVPALALLSIIGLILFICLRKHKKN